MMRKGLLWSLLIALFSTGTVWAQAAKQNLRPPAMGREGMVTAAHPLASLAGQKMLAKGGNAIDAVVAAAAALNAVEPFMSGTGGVGYMLFYSAKDKKVRSLVFGGWVPKNFDVQKVKDIIRFDDGAGHGGRMEGIGPRTVAVPGNLAGWNRALKDFGTKSLQDVFEPTIQYLEQGVTVTEYDQAMWDGITQRVAPHPEAAAIFLKPDQSGYKVGDQFSNKPLAKTMRRIAKDGIDVFYKGEIAREIAAAFQKDGGFITLEDLASVPDKVQWTAPLSVQYRGYTVYNNPPPGMGLQQLQTLKIMEGFDVKKMGHNSAEYLAHLMEAIALSRLDSDKYIGDPAFVKVPVNELVSEEYIQKQREKVVANVKKRFADQKKQSYRLRPEPVIEVANNDKYRYATTSLSAVDKWGNVVVITQTHGGGFGSGYVAGKTGVVFNNALEWMSLQPGLASSFEPGKGVSWCIGGMMQFHKAGKPYLVVGSPGSFGILQSVPQVAMNVIDFGMNIQDAISAPRFRWKDELGSVPAKEVIIETRIPPKTLQTLKELGFKLDTSLGDWTMTVGGAQGVTIDPTSGWLMGGADPRRNGYAIGF
ncbi:gamma-glutamyltransferase [Larkinella harenae]